MTTVDESRDVRQQSDVPDVTTLRKLFRHLQAWESAFEQFGIDTVTDEHNNSYHISDIQYLYGCRTRLTRRQRQAIEMCLYLDMREVDVSIAMGVSPTNPVAMYATNGLKRILGMVRDGELDHFRTGHPQS